MPGNSLEREGAWTLSREIRQGQLKGIEEEETGKGTRVSGDEMVLTAAEG